MIKKYVYGEPFETEALTENIETAEGKDIRAFRSSMPASRSWIGIRCL